MQKIVQINGDTKWNSTSELQKNNGLKERGENLNKTDPNNKDPMKWIRKSSHRRKGRTISLSDTGIIDNSLSANTQNQEKLTKLHFFTSAVNNDEMELNLPESGQGFFLSANPFRIEEDQKNCRNTYFELIQHEVNHLREKFELNNRNYQIDDLIRLTDNSKKILSYRAAEKYANCDEKRIYYSQEFRRVEIERRVGLCLFLKVYERMINIINDELDLNMKHGSENLIAFNIGGDSGDIIKNKWKQIIGILDDKQEFLPEIWELAISEYMFYHM